MGLGLKLNPQTGNLDVVRNVRAVSGTTLLVPGNLTVNADNTKFDISAGSGEVVDSTTNPLRPVIKKVSWGAKIGVTATQIANSADSYIYIDVNGDVIQKDDYELVDQRDYIFIGNLIHPDLATINAVGNVTNSLGLDLNLSFSDFSFKYGTVNVSGNLFSSNGNNLKLDKTAGERFYFGLNAKVDPKNPNVVSDLATSPTTFFHTWRDGIGGFNASAPITDLNVNRYDDGTGGTTQPNGVMDTGYWQVFKIYQGSVIVIHHGQAQYSRKVDAFNAIQSEVFETNPQIDPLPIRAWLIVRQGSTSLQTENNAIFVQIEKPQGLINKAIPQLTFKSYSFTSRGVGAGTYYQAGYYEAPAKDSNLNQASPTQVLGTANISYAAHAFIVAGGPGTTDGTTLVLTVTGTSIDDAGVRTPGDSEIVVSSAASAALNDYYETPKKWIGQVTYTLTSNGTTFSFDFNYGFAKYEDFGNRNFKITDFEVVGLGAANDSNFEVRLLKHSPTGWVYSAAAFVPGDSELAVLSSTHGAESNLGNGLPFAFKRTNLSADIDGAGSEGIIIETTTGQNNSVQIMDMHIGVEL